MNNDFLSPIRNAIANIFSSGVTKTEKMSDNETAAKALKRESKQELNAANRQSMDPAKQAKGLEKLGQYAKYGLTPLVGIGYLVGSPLMVLSNLPELIGIIPSATGIMKPDNIVEQGFNKLAYFMGMPLNKSRDLLDWIKK